jgi:HD superfamily phosphohydrolase YqeK
MSRLDEIVFLADGLEPGRDFPQRAALERLAFADPAHAMLETLRASIAYNERKGAVAAPATLAALHAYERTTACPT